VNLGMLIGMQQSHHCGIETKSGICNVSIPFLQQSHHCGIETEAVLAKLEAMAEQQSHHCGIETHGSGSAP